MICIKKCYLAGMWSILCLFPISVLQAQTYTFDPQHSFVAWQVSHFGFSNPSGKWMVTGTLQFDQNAIEQSKVEATIPVANVITGISELDKHLKGKIFFDTERFPTATFVSQRVEGQKSSMKIHGILTLHGVSKEVVLTAQLNKIGTNPVTERETVGFSGNTTLLRSDFGINGLLPGVGDKVFLNIEIEAYRT